MPGNPNPNQSNLKPFKKGQCGNPKGRPKIPDLSEAISKILNEEKDGMIALDAVLKALRARAIKGDVRAIQELLDRGYGKAKQHIDHSNQDGTLRPTITVLSEKGKNELDKI